MKPTRLVENDRRGARLLVPDEPAPLRCCVCLVDATEEELCRGRRGYGRVCGRCFVRATLEVLDAAVAQRRASGRAATRS